MAPFQRRAQRLVSAQHDARTDREHVEALVETRAQAFDAEQRQARGGEFDGERNAVQPPADLDDRRCIRRRQREIRIDSLRACDKEFDGTSLRRIRSAIVGRYREAPYAIDVFFRRLQRFLAGHEKAHLGRGAPHGFDELGDGIDEMFAIVEHEQELLRREQRSDRLARQAVARKLHAQRPGDGRRHERAIAQCGQFDPPDPVGKVGGRFDSDLRCRGLRDARLADTARADDRHDDMLAQERLDRRQILRTAIQRKQLRRQIRGHASSDRRRSRRSGRADAGPIVRWHRVATFDRKQEAIAAPRNGGDHAFA